MTQNSTDSYPTLVVEDDPLPFQLIEAKLQSLGHLVTSAVNGKEAVDLIKRGVFPILITDLNMPMMVRFRTMSGRQDSRPTRLCLHHHSH